MDIAKTLSLFYIIFKVENHASIISNVYNHSESSTYAPFTPFTPFSIQYGIGYAKGFLSMDTVNFESFSIKNQTFAEITDTDRVNPVYVILIFLFLRKRCLVHTDSLKTKKELFNSNTQRVI